MTDQELLFKKLGQIELYLRQLVEFGDPARIESDLRVQRFVEHTLLMAVQATLDAASHIVASERLGEPNANRQLFELLAEAGWLEASLAERLIQMAGFRNILVHEYAEVDLAIVRDVAENRVEDLVQFIEAVRRRLAEF